MHALLGKFISYCMILQLALKASHLDNGVQNRSVKQKHISAFFKY